MKGAIANMKIKDITVGQIFGIAFILAVVFISSTCIDQIIKDWKAKRMCNEVYGKDGQAEVEACLKREADREVSNEAKNR